jgi:MFS superfamily sulfate permease-like transporter
MTASARGWLKTIIPAASWLPNYEGKWFRFDLAAGITLAAHLLPSADVIDHFQSSSRS